MSRLRRFFPRSWLEYFFEDSLDLLNINSRKRKGEQMIFSSIDRELTNIEFLPMLYEAIRDKRVLSIKYKPYDEILQIFDFHPHILKEHNGRWFLFGHATGKEPEFGYNLALDRIVDKPITLPLNEKYIPAPKGFYSEFFKNIVGVSHIKDSKPENIIIRALNKGIFKLTETKKIQHSQITIKAFDHYEDGAYGEFALCVEVNNELLGRILQMGEGLEIVSPIIVRNKIAKRIEVMYNLYQ